MDKNKKDRLDAALDNVLIKEEGEIFTRIEEVEFEIQVKDTKAIAYCHCLRQDANGNLRLHDLIEFIDTKIVDYAIPKKEINDAKENDNRTGSTSKIMALRRKAKKLFVELEKTGEGGELLLYILILEILKLPQLISKMSLKTSGALHYQGSDGVHFKYHADTKKLSLYWGESKMHKNISSGITDCFKSLNGFLIDAFSTKSTQERDLQLISAELLNNLADENLENELAHFFDKDKEASNNLEYKGICFIGYDCDKYPTSTSTKTMEKIKREVKEELIKHYPKITKGIKKYPRLDSKEIHIFLMPFPSIDEFRKYYLETLRS